MMWYGINTSDMFGLAALIMASGVASYEDYSNAYKMFKSIMLYLFQFVKIFLKYLNYVFYLWSWDVRPFRNWNKNHEAT